MKFRGIPRLYRRAVLIYIVTIAAPVCGLLWLGVKSFERQRQSLVALTADKLAGALVEITLARPGVRSDGDTGRIQLNKPSAKRGSHVATNIDPYRTQSG